MQGHLGYKGCISTKAVLNWLRKIPTALQAERCAGSGMHRDCHYPYRYKGAAQHRRWIYSTFRLLVTGIYICFFVLVMLDCNSYLMDLVICSARIIPLPPLVRLFAS